MNTNLGVLRHLVGRHSFAISIASSLVLGFCGITPAQARGFSTTNFPCAPCKAAPEGYRCKAQVNEKGCPTKINGKAYCTWKDCSAAGNMNNRAPVDVTQSASAARSSGSIAESEQALEEQIAFRDSLDDAQRSAADRRITPDEKSAFDAGLKRADERVNGQSTTAAAPQQNAAMAAGPRRISPEGVYDDPLPANGPTYPSFANPDLQGNRFAGNTGTGNTDTGYEGSGGYDGGTATFGGGSIGSSDYPSFTNPNLHEKPGPTVEAAARLEKGSANKELSTQEVLDQEGRNSGGGGGSFVNSGAEFTGDPCSKASLIDKKFTCSGTQTVIQGAQIMNTIAQTTQSTALGGMGQIKQMEAAQEGTQSAAIKAAAMEAEALPSEGGQKKTAMMASVHNPFQEEPAASPPPSSSADSPDGRVPGEPIKKTQFFTAEGSASPEAANPAKPAAVSTVEMSAPEPAPTAVPAAASAPSPVISQSANASTAPAQTDGAAKAGSKPSSAPSRAQAVADLSASGAGNKKLLVAAAMILLFLVSGAAATAYYKFIVLKAPEITQEQKTQLAEIDGLVDAFENSSLQQAFDKAEQLLKASPTLVQPTAARLRALTAEVDLTNFRMFLKKMRLDNLKSALKAETDPEKQKLKAAEQEELPFWLR